MCVINIVHGSDEIMRERISDFVERAIRAIGRDIDTEIEKAIARETGGILNKTNQTSNSNVKPNGFVKYKNNNK